MQSLNAFLPCRKGSERVINKNIRKFAEFPFGLIQLKLNQLINVRSISKIYLSTNDDEILEFADSMKCSKIILHRRDEHLCQGTTQTDDLIDLVEDLITDGDILWTHVTSPFITSKIYEDLIKEYYWQLKKGHDSLMTVNEIKGFLWNSMGPISYKRNKVKWPRTQTIDPLFEINSGAFIASANTYRTLKDRIGKNPFLYILDKISGFDIDWEDDFELANFIYEQRRNKS